MPGSSTPRECDALALSRAALLPSGRPDAVGFPHRMILELNTQPTDTPVQRFKYSLTAAFAWLGARVVRYAFPVRLFHSLLHTGFIPALSRAEVLAPQIYRNLNWDLAFNVIRTEIPRCPGAQRQWPRSSP